MSPTKTPARPSNEEIASTLDQIANLLEAQDANPFRVRSFRQGADSVRDADQPIAELFWKDGREALEKLPGIGRGLAGVIDEIITRGRSELLQRLRGEVAPAELFAEVPGIGPRLGQRVAEQLDIHTLPELEQAARDGRLEQVPGFGPRRVEDVQVGLAGMLSGAAQAWTFRTEEKKPGEEQKERPSVGALLEVDADYRRRAEADSLPKIAPRRLNPKHEAWLPILRTSRDGWKVTALYSNTARAHELDKTHDWVVIYYTRPGQRGQATVVTGENGRRIVRGREAESRRYYGEQAE